MRFNIGSSEKSLVLSRRATKERFEQQMKLIREDLKQTQSCAKTHCLFIRKKVHQDVLFLFFFLPWKVLNIQIKSIF